MNEHLPKAIETVERLMSEHAADEDFGNALLRSLDTKFVNCRRFSGGTNHLTICGLKVTSTAGGRNMVSHWLRVAMAAVEAET